jgi:hypothetical protein
VRQPCARAAGGGAQWVLFGSDCRLRGVRFIWRHRGPPAEGDALVSPSRLLLVVIRLLVLCPRHQEAPTEYQKKKGSNCLFFASLLHAPVSGSLCSAAKLSFYLHWAALSGSQQRDIFFRIREILRSHSFLNGNNCPSYVNPLLLGVEPRISGMQSGCSSQLV